MDEKYFIFNFNQRFFEAKFLRKNIKQRVFKNLILIGRFG